MAGYSGTPLAQKLGIKSGHMCALLYAPANFSDLIGELPPDVKTVQSLAGKQLFDVIVFFTHSEAKLVEKFEILRDRLTVAGGLWISWPKKASKVATDLNENRIRDIGLGLGLVDNKVCAVDETYSGLRFVRRLKDRPK